MSDQSFHYVSYCTLSFWRTCFRVPRQSPPKWGNNIRSLDSSRRSSLSLLTLDGSCLRPCDTQPIVFFKIWAFLTKYRAAVSSFSTFVFVLLQLLEFTVVLECNVWINVTQEQFNTANCSMIIPFFHFKGILFYFLTMDVPWINPTHLFFL